MFLLASNFLCGRFTRGRYKKHVQPRVINAHNGPRFKKQHPEAGSQTIIVTMLTRTQMQRMRVRVRVRRSTAPAGVLPESANLELAISRAWLRTLSPLSRIVRCCLVVPRLSLFRVFLFYIGCHVRLFLIRLRSHSARRSASLWRSWSWRPSPNDSSSLPGVLYRRSTKAMGVLL